MAYDQAHPVGNEGGRMALTHWALHQETTVTNDEFKAAMLDLVAMVHTEQKEQRALLKQIMTVAIDTNAEVSTLRSRLLEQASRHGQEIHKHETALLKQDVRITLLERKFETDFEPDIVTDAE